MVIEELFHIPRILQTDGLRAITTCCKQTAVSSYTISVIYLKYTFYVIISNEFFWKKEEVITICIKNGVWWSQQFSINNYIQRCTGVRNILIACEESAWWRSVDLLHSFIMFGIFFCVSPVRLHNRGFLFHYQYLFIYYFSRLCFILCSFIQPITTLFLFFFYVSLFHFIISFRMALLQSNARAWLFVVQFNPKGFKTKFSSVNIPAKDLLEWCEADAV